MKPNGVVKAFVGRLGDGATLTAVGGLAEDGTWSFFAEPYKRAGLLAGTLAFQDNAIGGNFVWRTLMPTTHTLAALGSRFAPGISFRRRRPSEHSTCYEAGVFGLTFRGNFLDPTVSSTQPALSFAMAIFNASASRGPRRDVLRVMTRMVLEGDGLRGRKTKHLSGGNPSTAMRGMRVTPIPAPIMDFRDSILAAMETDAAPTLFALQKLTA